MSPDPYTMSQALGGNIPPEFMFIVVGVNLILLATFGIWLFGSLLRRHGIHRPTGQCPPRALPLCRWHGQVL